MEQGTLDFGGRVRVDRLAPVCADGAEWESRVAALWDVLAREVGSVLPSHLRARAEAAGLGEPPHGPNAWGQLAAKQRAKGWRKEFVGVTSTTPSRNCAPDVWRWVAPGSAA